MDNQQVHTAQHRELCSLPRGLDTDSVRTTSRKISSTRSWPGSWSSQPPTGTTSQTRPRYPSRPGSGGSGVSRGPRLSQGMVACRGALTCGLLSCRGALACPGGLSALLVLSSGSVWTCGSLRSAVPEILRWILKAGLAVFPMCRGHPLSAYGRFSMLLSRFSRVRLSVTP